MKSKIGDCIAELGDGDHADDEPTELSELSGIGDVDGFSVHACGMGNLIDGQPGLGFPKNIKWCGAPSTTRAQFF